MAMDRLTWARMWRAALVGAAISSAVLIAGCGKNSGGGGNHNQNTHLDPCPEGTEAKEAACVPVFDNCSATDEIPVLGGGCLPVGVERCAYGDGCAPGFTGDGAGACDPVLPAAECGAGTLAVLGQTACQDIRDCGAAPWGNVPTDANTIHVDAGYSGGSSDGSASAPYTTIGAALAVATGGDHIAVAAGTYAENLTLNAPVTIAGRCPGLVIVQGQSGGAQDPPVVTLNASASGARLEGLRLTGPGAGVTLNQAEHVVLDEVEITDVGGYGVYLQRGGSVRLRRVKIARASVAGILLYGGSVAMDDSVVRDTASSPDGSFGRGLDLGADHMGSGGLPSLDATRIVVTGNHESGILLAGGDATVRDSLVADTLANSGTGQAGIGIQTQCDTTSADCPTLVVTGSVVQGNHASGIMALGTRLTLRDTVIRDTQPQDADDRFGSGLVAQCDPSLASCQPLQATCLTVDGNHQAGVSIAGIPADLLGLLVRDTAAQQSDLRSGAGATFQCEMITGNCADVALTDSGLTGNTYAGIYLQGSDLELQGSYVAHTLPGEEADEEGLALYAQCDTASGGCPHLDIDASLFQAHHTEGIAVYGGATTMTRSTVDNVEAQVSDGEYGFGVYVDGQTVVTLPTFDASACNIADGTVAGIFFYQSGGFVTRTWVHGAQYSVVQADDAAVLTDNLLEGTDQDEPLVQ